MTDFEIEQFTVALLTAWQNDQIEWVVNELNKVNPNDLRELVIKLVVFSTVFLQEAAEECGETAETALAYLGQLIAKYPEGEIPEDE